MLRVDSFYLPYGRHRKFPVAYLLAYTSKQAEARHKLESIFPIAESNFAAKAIYLGFVGRRFFGFLTYFIFQKLSLLFKLFVNTAMRLASYSHTPQHSGSSPRA